MLYILTIEDSLSFDYVLKNLVMIFGILRILFPGKIERIATNKSYL